MFGKRKPPQKPKSAAQTPAKPIEREIVRPVETPVVEAAAAAAAAAAGTWRDTPEASAPGSEGRKLVVGREICLTGEIRACEKLVVEGRVEADLTDSQFLEVSKPGYFKGNAVVQNCEISGTFEGELFVHGYLLVESTGRVNGSVYYGELKVERGGRINGSMELVELSTPQDVDAVPEELLQNQAIGASIPRRVPPLDAVEEKTDDAAKSDKDTPDLAESGSG